MMYVEREKGLERIVRTAQKLYVLSVHYFNILDLLARFAINQELIK